MNNCAFVVYHDDSGNEYMTFSKPLYYSEELENALLKLTWYERWNIVSGGLSVLKKEDILRKEEYTKDSKCMSLNQKRLKNIRKIFKKEKREA